MNRNLAASLLLAIVIIASGCADASQSPDNSNQSLNDSDERINASSQGSKSSGDTQKLVKEGNVLNYNLGDGSVSLVFYEETSNSIMVTDTGNTYDEGKIYKNNWTHSNNDAFTYTLYSFLSGIKDDKVERLMESGEEVRYEEAGRTVNLARSDVSQYKGFNSYNITYEAGSRTFNYVFHSMKPYVLLKADLGGSVLEFTSVENTDSPEELISN